MERRVLIGIGSNVGECASNCIEGILRITANPKAKLLAASSLYATSPVSDVPQDDFVNCVIAVEWEDSPFVLLHVLNDIEYAMGRIRSVENGPRTIDLDILFFEDIVLDSPLLTIPHPRLHKRKFALIPCLEIDPKIIHPLYKKPLSAFLDGIDASQAISLHIEADEVYRRTGAHVR